MGKVYYETKMNSIPSNCLDCIMCDNGACRLPDAKNSNSDSILRKYLKERHKDCPLVEVK